MMIRRVVNTAIQSAARRHGLPRPSTYSPLMPTSSGCGVEDAVCAHDNIQWNFSLRSTIFDTLSGFLRRDAAFVSLDALVSTRSDMRAEDADCVADVEESTNDGGADFPPSLWAISTLKRRKKMINKHKLRKRRKKLRLKSKK
mmetsp:Transcript_21484/g.50505  ORF Transcript_21484/g.50505 Transcript_21484/m.50505 type:complete len:143 (-) Transcript_21484:100-528(-)